MALLMLVVLGWCAVSVAAAGFFAALCAGGRKSAALEASAGQQPSSGQRVTQY